jgi:uncharacterized membrane protein
MTNDDVTPASTPRNGAATSTVYPAVLVDDRTQRLRTLTHILYGLFAAFWFTGGFSMLVAVIIAYVKRDDVAGTPYQAHFDWQIRTFWWALLWAVIGGILVFAVIGFAVLWALGIWLLYRIIKGWFYLYDNKPLAGTRLL